MKFIKLRLKKSKNFKYTGVLKKRVKIRGERRSEKF
jgi:hypothetical protein